MLEATGRRDCARYHFFGFERRLRRRRVRSRIGRTALSLSLPAARLLAITLARGRMRRRTPSNFAETRVFPFGLEGPEAVGLEYRVRLGAIAQLIERAGADGSALAD